MPKRLRTPVVVCALMCSSFVTQTALAEGAVNINPPTELLQWAESTDRNGLDAQVPTVAREVLIQRITKLRASLVRHEEELQAAVEEKQLGIGDAIITALIPGGLLYAGYRKHAWDEAKDNLARVSDQIDELADELLSFQYATGTVVVAQLR
jgi:hypothetical protein